MKIPTNLNSYSVSTSIDIEKKMGLLMREGAETHRENKNGLRFCNNFKRILQMKSYFDLTILNLN